MNREVRPILTLLAGSMLVLSGLAILAKNESNVLAYRTAALRHGGIVVNASKTGPTRANNGDMVLVSGVPQVIKPAIDPVFGIRVDTPVLWRTTAMFQWREVDYAGSLTYEMDWIDHHVDSHAFRRRAYHRNPSVMPFGSGRFVAGEVHLDGFVLSRRLVQAIPGRHAVTPDFSTLRPNLAASFRPYRGSLVTSDNVSSPQLGDIRVSWQGVPKQVVTLIAQNQDGTLKPAVDVEIGPGYQMQVGKLQVPDLQPDLPGVPYLPWLWRVLSLLLAVTGAYVLLQAVPTRRNGLGPAVGLGLVLVCGLSGVMWISARSDVATLLLGVSALALGITAWQLYERQEPD